MQGTHFLSGLLVFAASFAVLIRQPALDSTPRGHQSHAASTESSMGLEWTTDPSRSTDWRGLTEAGGVDVLAQTLGGDWSWLETAAELADPFFVAAERRACNAKYGSAIEGQCAYTLSYIAADEQRGLGKIVYARASLRDRESMPTAEAANDPNCEDYVGCLAQARLGHLVPLPLEPRTSEIAILEHIQSRWGDPVLFDAERLPKLIEFWGQERHHLVTKDSRGEITTTRDALRFRFVKSLVPYLQQHLKRIQETTDATR